MLELGIGRVEMCRDQGCAVVLVWNTYWVERVVVCGWESEAVEMFSPSSAEIDTLCDVRMLQ